MGDVLRRLCYPLVLPFIVGTVWLHAWATRQDSRAFAPHLPAAGVEPKTGAAVVTVPGPGPGATYRLSTGDDTVASVEADGE